MDGMTALDGQKKPFANIQNVLKIQMFYGTNSA